MTLKIIARIKSDFPEKFGIPRQSGLADTRATIVFEPEFRHPDAIKEIEGFSHLWLIWQFSQAVRENWSPTVRPPRLGGNRKIGVFATRSPFRPNPLGLSSVKLDGVGYNRADGTVLYVSGADLMDGTPIYDIKPYLPYTDCHPEATGGFAPAPPEGLQVNFPPEMLVQIPAEKQSGLLEVLTQDPRPAYQADEERVYTMSFAGFEISFMVSGNTLRICGVRKS